MRLTHLSKSGSIKMVDVGGKSRTRRRALVCGMVVMKPATLEAISKERVKKGNVLETARLAGILAAKQTPRLIPLCHPVNITNIRIEFRYTNPKSQIPNPNNAIIKIKTTVEGYDRTGFEMEAMTATAVAALTIYDMCKAIDRGMEITDIKLLEKSGGRSGHYKRSHRLHRL